ARRMRRLLYPGKKSRPEARLFRWYLVTLHASRKIIKRDGVSPDWQILKRALQDYRADSSVEAAEANMIVHALTVPNDPYYSSSYTFGPYPDLWGMQRIQA